jgi:bifunctional NMN adenylyltransferase/nudix hydrolase
MFPQFSYIESDRNQFISATDVRKFWFEQKFEKIESVAPEKTLDFLESYPTVDYYNLVDEYEFIENYKRRWEIAPYPVIFQTVDAVVVRSNHILLIKRRSSPGKGLWALPGGFLNNSEKLLDGCLRELREETNLSIPEKVLIGSLVKQKRFDHPDRSLRGRTITEAFYFNLPNGKLDKVKGSDDAIKAKWVHINDVKSNEMFEDHWHIINYFTRIK